MSKQSALLLLLLLLLVACSGRSDGSGNRSSPTGVASEPTVAVSPALAEPTQTTGAESEETQPQSDASIEEVIEYEMKGSFDYFWEQANTDVESAGFGLVRDRFPGSEGIASVAAVGFGLTAYPIGVEKGYISHQEGFDRANGTLDTLLAMERVEGFYYHFVDMESGERAWESEVSNIDTAILVMGAIAAGEYFGGEVQLKSKELYDGVNWPWYVDESRDMFHMSYRPEEDFAGHWDFYAEQLMLYVLAAGSDTHPVDDTTYYGFTRHLAAYGEGEPFIHSWFGSLFTHQFSHAWIDFRGYTDREGVDWFENSVHASQAQVDFAIDMADEYDGLGADSWGLTASDGPNGYNGLYGAPPSGYDNQAHLVDGTVPPAGAIGSIIFIPEAAERAMLTYYSIEPLRGEYGFQDAYNLTEEWYASDVISIDKGISLLMLANHYENDLVHQYVMRNEEILAGLDRLGISKTE